ncbi:SDR family NAD(P)-dependent oxidoreductase [Conexibacter sp. SYSU D00693]|uniref:SDR family NAD(P)-dependent oxidoreductase n=1 Tax=Conexibacter sp. SYSU D00693 TaxID=2812560 RepID=UPI00196AEE46|nr:SDR family NAD(P)-dependent oxidoreductase [Conexibacter sp. SYSU D00693]
MAKTPRTLAGKVVIVTGAAGGVGGALARQLYQEGAHVSICDINADAVAAKVQEVSSGAGAGRIIGRALDLADRAAYTAFIEWTEEQLGALDVLVNNAGIMPVGPFEQEPEATAAKQVDVNLHAVLHGTKEALRRFKPRGHGHVVNVASGAGWVPGAGGATYSATKFGVVGLTEALALELHGSGVDVSVVAPAVIKSQMSTGIGEVKGLKASSPDEVAAAIVEGLKQPRFAIFVPKAMGVMALTYSVLPYRVRGFLARVTGSDKLLLNVDTAARERYEAAVLGGAAQGPAPAAPQGNGKAPKERAAA